VGWLGWRVCLKGLAPFPPYFGCFLVCVSLLQTGGIFPCFFSFFARWGLFSLSSICLPLVPPPFLVSNVFLPSVFLPSWRVSQTSSFGTSSPILPSPLKFPQRALFLTRSFARSRCFRPNTPAFFFELEVSQVLSSSYKTLFDPPQSAILPSTLSSPFEPFVCLHLLNCPRPCSMFLPLFSPEETPVLWLLRFSRF